jgi:hypothetical protein
MGDVNESVEDAIAQRWIADLLVPSRDGHCEVRTVERTGHFGRWALQVK